MHSFINNPNQVESVFNLKWSQEKESLENANLQVGLIPLARTTFDLELANEVFAQAVTELSTAGFTLHGPNSLITQVDELTQTIEHITSVELDLTLILQTTFADSSMVIELANELHAPLLLWAIPEEHSGGRLRLNSLCGINLAAHALKRAGIHYDTLYAAPTDDDVLAQVRIRALAGRAHRLLRQAKIGRIGDHPDGMDTCEFDADALKRIFGLDIVQVELKTVFQGVNKTDDQSVDDVLKQLRPEIDELDTLDSQATRKSLASYLTMRRIAEDQGLDGLAVRCWPEFFTDLGCAACGAMSMLSNELIPCSCEADVNGTVTQLILQSISDEPAFGTDIVSLDDKSDALVIWHCGLAPLSMADPQGPRRGTIHSNRNLPLLFEFTLKPGPVTVARLTESSGEYRLVSGRGEIIRGPMNFFGTSGLLRFDRSAREILDVILTEGLEHHISLTYGDYAEVMIAFARKLNIPILQLTQ
jgi:L-fucose isomerase-like protein